MRPIKITTLFASVAQLRPKWAKNTKLREHLVHWMGNSKPLSQNRYGLWSHGSPGNLFAKWKGLTLKSIKKPQLDFCIKNILCKLLNLYNVAIGTKWDTVAYFVALESPDSIPVSYCAQQSSPVALTTSFYPSGYNAM